MLNRLMPCSQLETDHLTNHTLPEICMIIREWRGRAAPGKAEAYPAHFRRTVLPELRGIAGFCGAHLSQRGTSNISNSWFLLAGSQWMRSAHLPAQTPNERLWSRARWQP